ncbi:MAG: PEP-CTERM sorting domain-containing protein [Pseudomonadota bacterium]
MVPALNQLSAAILAATTIGLVSIGSAQATPMTYTFTGSGAGLADGSAFSGAFSFVFTADSSAIDSSGPPFFRLTNVAGTFTEGAFSATLTPTVTIVATADPTLPRINFFNATFDNGLGLQDSAVDSYDLSTAIGPITVTAPGTDTSFLTPTFGGGSFAAVGGGSVSLTSDESLTFTAAVLPVPEPLSLGIFGASLAGLGLLRRRKTP